MTQNLEALSRRSASMEGIRGIVHTMKTLSVINSTPYEHAALAVQAYHHTVLDGLHAFLSQVELRPSPPPNARRQVVIVFGSDHGLCGSYNETLAAHVIDRIEGKTIVLCVGAQMEAALREGGVTPRDTFLPPASVDGVGRLSNLLIGALDRLQQEGAGSEMVVSLAYFMRDGEAGQRPEMAGLLPLDRAFVEQMQAKPWVSRSLPSINMASDELFKALIKEHLFASLFRASAEALVTENAARLALMQQAERSIDDKLEGLMGQTRQLRQSEITTELLDVIIGFEALKKRRKPAAR